MIHIKIFIDFLNIYTYYDKKFSQILKKGALAQSVEQRTENPCVRSSILRGATKKQVHGLENKNSMFDSFNPKPAL